MPSKINWAAAIQPLLEKYKDHQHPLEYKNVYQLVVMVVLSAQSTDQLVNQRAPDLFAKFPDMAVLATATAQDLFPLLKGIRNFANKAKWLMEIARTIKKDSHIPLSLEKLVELPGIGRKSANVILRETGALPEGIIVDLHVVRVAPRLGVVTATDPKKIEEQLMKKLPSSEWDAGMAMSFLGREICRPQPKCEICLMNTVCQFYNRNKKKKGTKKN